MIYFFFFRIYCDRDSLRQFLKISRSQSVEPVSEIKDIYLLKYIYSLLFHYFLLKNFTVIHIHTNHQHSCKVILLLTQKRDCFCLTVVACWYPLYLKINFLMTGCKLTFWVTFCERNHLSKWLTILPKDRHQVPNSV